MRRLLLVLTVLFPLAAAGATDFLVGPPGSGAAFSNVQAAVDAAAPGDRVLVLPGQYNGTVFLDKAIELLGSGSTTTQLRSIATFLPGFVSPTLVVADLAAGARVRVSGFEITVGGALTFPIPFLVQVRDCAGRVELSDLLLSQGPIPPYPQGTPAGFLYLQDAQQVVATGVRNTASATAIFPFPGGVAPTDGLSGAVVEQSSAWLAECAFQGAARQGATSGFGGNGGHGILAIGSSIHLGRTSVRGGQSGGLQNGVPGSGGSGIFATGSDLLVHGGTGNAIVGANAVEPIPFSGSLGTAGDAVTLDAASALAYAADVVLTPGAPSATLPGGLSIDAPPGSSVTALGQRQPTLAIDPVLAPLGSPLALEIEGEPGTIHLRALSTATGPALAIPGVSGSLLLDLGVFFLAPPVALGGSGAAVLASGIPADPFLAGASIVEQSAQIGAAGVSLGPPALLSVGH